MLVIALMNAVVIFFIVCLRLVAIYRIGNGTDTRQTYTVGREKSTDEEDVITMEEFTNFLFSPGELLSMTNRLNKLEDDNSYLREQVQQFISYFETGSIGELVQSYIPVHLKSTTTSFASTPHSEDKVL